MVGNPARESYWRILLENRVENLLLPFANAPPESSIDLHDSRFIARNAGIAAHDLLPTMKKYTVCQLS